MIAGIELNSYNTNNTIIGYESDISDRSCGNTITGAYNWSDGNYNIITGCHNKIDGNYNIIYGNHNNITGNYNIIIGNHIVYKGDQYSKEIMDKIIYRNWAIRQFDLIDDIKNKIKDLI